jgi:hypothetical protein
MPGIARVMHAMHSSLKACGTGWLSKRPCGLALPELILDRYNIARGRVHYQAHRTISLSTAIAAEKLLIDSTIFVGAQFNIFRFEVDFGRNNLIRFQGAVNGTRLKTVKQFY